MVSTSFLFVTPSSPVEAHRLFGSTYQLHLQAQRVDQANKEETGVKLPDSSLLGLLFDFVSGRDTFLRNVDGLLPYYTASQCNKYTKTTLTLTPNYRTGWSRGYILDLNSEGARFESRPGHQVS
jgi:hypothetical protein